MVSASSCTLVGRNSANQVVHVRRSEFTVAATSGLALGAVSPADVGDSFTFTITAGNASVPVNLTSGVSGGTATVTLTCKATSACLHCVLLLTAIPDATSVLSCSSLALRVGDTSSCSIVPNNHSFSIYAFTSAFTLSLTPSVGARTALLPANYGNAFSFVYNTSRVLAETGSVVLSDAVSPSVTFQVSAVPDNVTLVCTSNNVLVSTSVTCTVVGYQSGVQVFVRSSDITLNASVGSVSALSATFANSFTFTYNATAVSQTATLRASVATAFAEVPLIIYAIPTNATLACVETLLWVGNATQCTVVPFVGTTQVFALAADVTVSTTGTSGIAGALSATIANAFTFTFTASSTVTGVTQVKTAAFATVDITVTGAYVKQLC